jgi:dTMP kinase
VFIAIEGIDGSGKTTISRMLYSYLKETGFDTYLTKEPTDSFNIARRDEISRDPEDGVNLFFQFTLDRFKHQREIGKQIGEGKTVICDRYILSSYCYQGPVIESALGSREKAIKWMEEVSGIITVRPDVTVYLKLTPETAVRRVSKRSVLSGFENESFLALVSSYYDYLAQPPVIVIDAERGIGQVFDDVIVQLKKRIGSFC